MKTLLTTTALVLGASFGALAQTPDAMTTDAPAVETAIVGNVPAFRSSTFTGMRLYALDPEVVGVLPSTETDWDARWTSGPAFVSGRERWENVGSISDIVLTQDGALQGVLIDVGGFLGLGARTVMVDMDQLWFVTEQDDPEQIGDFNVVANLSRAQLESLPEWSDETLRVGFATGPAATAPAGSLARSEPSPTVGTSAAPMATEAAPVDLAAAPTADELLGAEVYDAAGDSIGSVSDLIMNGEVEVAEAVIDVGGFLGIGTHVVAVPVESLSILRDADGSARVEISLTREQLEALPPHS